MKNILVVFCLAAALSLPPAFGDTGGGTVVGGGGDGIASFFFGIAQSVGRQLTSLCKGSGSEACKGLPAYLASVALSSVLPRDRVLGDDGEGRDAGNNGKDEIYVSLSRWNELLTSPLDTSERQIRVVVHEYLVVAGKETNDSYPASDIIVQLLKNSGTPLSTIVGQAPTTHTWKAETNWVPVANKTVADFDFRAAVGGLSNQDVSLMLQTRPIKGDKTLSEVSVLVTSRRPPSSTIELRPEPSDPYFCYQHMTFLNSLSNPNVSIEASCPEFNKDDFYKSRVELHARVTLF
jgi:hypothetical protein